MSDRGFWKLRHLADTELESGLRELVARGRETDARVVAHLAEVETRRLHLKSGSESLFAYCQKRLNLSENQAFYRIVAARAARQYPSIFELLASGDIHLTSLSLLSKYLTPESHHELLSEARGRTKREVLELLATFAPRPDVRSTLRKLPARSARGDLPPTAIKPTVPSTTPTDPSTTPTDPSTTPTDPSTTSTDPSTTSTDPSTTSTDPSTTSTDPSTTSTDPSTTSTDPSTTSTDPSTTSTDPSTTGTAQALPVVKRPASPRAVPAGPTGSLEPLSRTAYRLQLNTTPQLKEKLERARDLMSHANPSGDLAVVVERAIDLLIAKLNQQRFGQSGPRSRAKHATPGANEPKVGACVELRQEPQARSRERPGSVRAGLGPEGAKNWQATHEPRPPNEQRKRRHIQNEIRRQLLARDGLCCTFTNESGQRCSARAFLQIHHEHAWSKGGSDTLDNLRLLCAAHNRLLAELEFGERRAG